MSSFQSCTLEPSDVSRLVSAQNPQIYLEVLQDVNTQSPWANIIPSAVTEANMGDTIESAITPRAVTNQDQVEPDFSNFFTEGCTLDGVQSQMGNFRFNTQLELLRGKTQPICLFANWDTVSGLLAQQIASLKREITYTYDTDVKAKLTRYSGLKGTVVAGVSPSASLEGGEWQVEVPYPSTLPDSKITFSWVKALLNYIDENFDVNMFGSGADAHARFIAGQQILDDMRNEIGPAGPSTSLQVGTTGGYNDAKKGLWEYVWQESNFRGIKFAKDRYPLRFNEVDGDGYPIWLAPRVKTAVTASGSGQGYYMAPNPEWANATYEVSVLVFQNSFRRRVPQQFVGQGEIRYPSQNFGGALQWVFRPDNGCNLWSDLGLFIYQIARAYQVGSGGAHSIIPIMWKRCTQDFGVTSCAS